MKPGVAQGGGGLNMSPGEVGTISRDDEDAEPYQVTSASGSVSGWFKESEVQCLPITTITTTPLTTAGITTEHTGRSTWINTVIAMCTLVLDPE